MSFAVWFEKPPFPESELSPGERIYQVGDKWVVTDQGQPSAEDVAKVVAAARKGAKA